MRIKDPKPEVQRLEELVTAIRMGEIRLPKFQRSFVWEKSDMLNLLDSIYNGYPIGSILLWNSTERLKSERRIFDFEVNENPTDTFPTDYLLDGQQRLTTLCGALFWKGTDKNSIWNIYFNLETEKFVYPDKQETMHLFPLNKLLKTSDFIRQCMKFEHQPRAQLYYENAEKLLQSVKNYKIAVVKIGDIALDEIAVVFERINSTGRKLTMVDLMRAATWKGGFDLSETIEKIIGEVRDRGFGELTDTNVLRSISAASGNGINKADIDKLRSLNADQLLIASQLALESTLKSVEFLMRRVGMPNVNFLPFGVQLTHLSEFFRVRKIVTERDLKILEQWFWSTTVSRYFSGANTGQNSRDLVAMRSFAEGAVDHIEQKDALDITGFLFDEFNLRTASSTGFALLLAKARPTTTLSGQSLTQTPLELIRGNFEDVLKDFKGYENRNIGQIFNPFKKDSRSSIIFSNDVNLEQHLLSSESRQYLVNIDLRGFFLSRVELVKNYIEMLTGKKVNIAIDEAK